MRASLTLRQASRELVISLHPCGQTTVLLQSARQIGTRQLMSRHASNRPPAVKRLNCTEDVKLTMYDDAIVIMKSYIKVSFDRHSLFHFIAIDRNLKHNIHYSNQTQPVSKT